MIQDQERTFGAVKLALKGYSRDAAGWANHENPRFLADVNGDGKADVVGFSCCGVHVAFSDGNVFKQFNNDPAQHILENRFCPQAGWKTQNEHPRALGDVNGDGKADIVGFGENGVYLSLFKDNLFTEPQLVLKSFLAKDGWVSAASHPEWPGWANGANHPRFLADVNGDGKADIVGFDEGAVYVGFSKGDSFDVKKVLEAFCIKQTWTYQNLRLLGDVNGDGKADIVGFAHDAVYVSLSKGDSFEMPKKMLEDFGPDQGWQQNENPRFLADINGDGKADIVGFGDSAVYVAFSKGDSFEPKKEFSWEFIPLTNKESWYDSNTYPRLLGDINGDGYDDVVGFGRLGMFFAHNKPVSETKGIYIAKAGQADRFIIKPETPIESEVKKATNLEQCKNIIHNFNPLEGDTIDLSHYGKFTVDQVSFAAFTSAQTATNQIPVSGVKINGEEDYVACVYGFDADKFFAPDFDPPHMLNPHDVITLLQAQNFHGEL